MSVTRTSSPVLTEISEDRCAVYASMAMPTNGTDNRGTAEVVAAVLLYTVAVLLALGSQHSVQRRL